MFKEGEIVTIYSDYETQTGFEGIGKLVKKLQGGLPFLLDEGGVVYCSELWLVKMGNRLVRRRLRYRLNTKKIPKTVLDIEKYYPPHLIDKFIEVNGKSVF